MSKSHNGTGGLWHNLVQGDRTPTYIGELTLPDGTNVRISAWETGGQGKRPAITMRINEVIPSKSTPPPVKPDSYDNFLDNAKEPEF
jgi:hypothetical protein